MQRPPNDNIAETSMNLIETVHLILADIYLTFKASVTYHIYISIYTTFRQL